MDALYLQVRNWEKFQHYQNRANAPHWIKVYPKLLDDYKFRQLPEIEQGRLLKVWMLAGRLRNRIPYDARYVAEVTGSKKVNLDLYVALGWLEVIDEDGAIVDPDSIHASTPVSTRTSRPRSMPEEKREEKEGEEVREETSKGRPVARPPARRELPDSEMVEKLLRVVGESADEGTRGVLTAFARQLPPASLAKVIESTGEQPGWKRARYANGALQSEINERSAA